ncbi:MAG: hypothetical protein JOZ75_02850 [Candidatus Dormibacteraeota bacterium]|nr:hypothetical protein [Candidatus Dormibacteraeota bacterium]
MRHTIPELSSPAATFEFLEARAHLWVAEELSELLVDRIDRLGMGRGHNAMVRAGEFGFVSLNCAVPSAMPESVA